MVCCGCNQKGQYNNECPNGPQLNLLGESDAEDSDIEVLNLGKRARDDEAPSHKPGRPKKRLTIADPLIAKEVGWPKVLPALRCLRCEEVSGNLLTSLLEKDKKTTQ